MLEQFSLFELPDASEHHLPVMRTRKQKTALSDEIPEQVAMRLKWARKIAFKRRTREDPDSTNDYWWSVEAIGRLHLELFEDWFNKFPALVLKSEQLDYWSWMLADTQEPFSFRDVLVVAGYRHPDSFIESVLLQAPDWVKEELRKKSTANAELKKKAVPSKKMEK